MDYELLRTALLGINILMTVGIWASGNRDRKDLATTDSINRVEKNLNDKIAIHEHRLTRVESNQDSALSHDDLGRVYDKLNEMNRNLSSSISETKGEIKHLSNNLNRLYDNELSKKS